MKRILLLLLLLYSINVSLTAQAQTVSGKVTNHNGTEPLPGVSIIVEGTNGGTTTDANGLYTIEGISSKSVLIFSYIGYATQKIAVKDQSTLDVKLIVDTKSLEEVVVIGYGTIKKSDLTGSLSQVKGAEINAFPATNVLQALSGRAPGVQVIQNTGAPGGAVSIRIRGTNSIQGNNEPLYVVDGFPMSGTNPTVINNSDIESIEILKDASATAIYGSRGANGVVIITTKRGKAGKTVVDVETSYSVQSLRKKLDLMNATEFANFYNKVAANDGLGERFSTSEIAAMGNGFDWQDFVFRKAPMQNHNVTVSGGNEKTQFSVAGSVFSQDGIIKNSGYKRYSLRAGVNHDISKKLSVSYNATLTRIRRDDQNSSANDRGGSLIGGTVSAYPTTTPFNEDGSYRNLSTAYPWGSNTMMNPINYFEETSNITLSNKVLANAALTYKILPSLSLKILGGVENSDDRSDSYTTLRFLASQGNASVSTSQSLNLLNENTLSFSKTYDKHSISAVGGFTFQNFRNTSLAASGSGFLSDVTESYNLGSAATPGIPGSGYSFSALLSYIGRVNYSWNNKYLATLSFRADGSSVYSNGNKWGYFPSGALAWRVSEEEFIKNRPWVSDLKFRVGWGMTGSQAISPYTTLNQLSAGKTVFGDALYTTFAPGTRLPGNLKWETTEQTDIGIDADLFNSRLRLSADYYVKNTRDLLNTVSLPSSLGFTSTIRNVGSIQNKGVELSADVSVLRGSFKWNVAGNISFNRNKITKLHEDKDILGSSYNISLVNDVVNILRVGSPLGAFYGYTEKGYDDKGKILFEDKNNDGIINAADKSIIGDPTPNFIYGLNSSMAFKGFDLTLFFQGSQGNNIFNLGSVNNTLDYGFGLNMPKEVYYNHWTPENPNAKYPIPSRSVSTYMSNRFVENGSFLRLRNVQLAYTFPMSSWNIKGISNFQLYVSGQNLLTFTKYSWWDPEVNSKGGSNSVNQGIDHHTYPTSKSYTIGLRASF